MPRAATTPRVTRDTGGWAKHGPGLISRRPELIPDACLCLYPDMPASETPFARRMQQLRASTIREILKVTAQPEVISLAGGLPAPELFPVDSVRAAAETVLSQGGAEALQYGESEGFKPLREWIAGKWAAGRSLPKPPTC